MVRILQWSLTGLLHDVAASLPESSVWMTQTIVVHAGLTPTGRLVSDTVLPHRPHDVEDENDRQDEERDTNRRANDDRYPRGSNCGRNDSKLYIVLTIK